MTTFRRITKRDDPAKLADIAAKHQALLMEALDIAKRKSKDMPNLVREILATGTVEGLATGLHSKAVAVSYRAARYKRTWHSLIPWQHLENTTAEDEAESMIDMIETNIHMADTDSWPSLPPENKKPEARR